jgi:hypothetical protein
VSFPRPDRFVSFPRPGRFPSCPRPLLLLLIVAGLQSIAWDVALPAFQGPDESAHFAYVQHLAETGEPPSSTTGSSPNSTEAQEALIWLNLEPLIGNLTARPAWSNADLSRWHQLERAMPRGSRANGSGPNPIAKNPPLYYAAMAIPYRLFVWLPLLKRLFILRLFNALCFLATVLMMWLIAGEVFGRVRWKQTLATAVVALEPQLAFMSAVINADNLLIAVTSAFLLASLRLVKRGPSMRRVVLAAGLAAAAILTHGRGLVTLPVLFVALVLALIVHRPARRDVLTRGAAAAGTIGLAFAAYVLFGRAVGGSSLYGGQVSELNTGAKNATFNMRQFLSSIYQFYFPNLSSLQARIGPAYGYRQVFIDTFYGTFGSLEVTFKARIYDVLQVLSALGLLGFYTACVTGWRRLRQSWPTVVLLLSLLVTLLGFLHYVSYRALLGDAGSDPLIVGRYLLPMISLFGLAITFTVGSLPRRLGPFAAGAIIALGVLLSLAGLGITAARFYA